MTRGRKAALAPGQAVGKYTILSDTGERIPGGSIIYEARCEPSRGGCGGTLRIYVNGCRQKGGPARVTRCACPYFSKGHPTKRERNAQVYAAYQGGMSAEKVARRYGITAQRVTQIVHTEAAARGEELRDKPTDRLPASNGREKISIQLPKDLLAAYFAGRLTSKRAAALLGLSAGMFRRLAVEQTGRSKQGERCLASRSRDAEAYRLYVGGATMEDLAARYDKTVGGAYQMVVRHRQRTGAPAKCPHLKPDKE